MRPLLLLLAFLSLAAFAATALAVIRLAQG